MIVNGYALLKGYEKKEAILKLMDLCNFKSEDKRGALVDYFVEGWSQEYCAEKYELSQSTVGEAITKMKRKHRETFQYVEAYCSGVGTRK